MTYLAATYSDKTSQWEVVRVTRENGKQTDSEPTGVTFAANDWRAMNRYLTSANVASAQS